MTDLASRILALFPPDGPTELSARAIIRSLSLGPMQTNRVHAALKSLVREGKLVAETDFGNPGVVYRLPHAVTIQQNGTVIATLRNGQCADVTEFIPQAWRSSQAILAARRTALIDEAVRRVNRAALRNILRHRDYPVFYGGAADCWGCGPTIAAIRSEFSKLCEERA